MNGIIFNEINYFFINDYNSFTTYKKYDININAARDQLIDCLKELQKLPPVFRLLFDNTYPKEARVDFCLARCEMA